MKVFRKGKEISEFLQLQKDNPHLNRTFPHLTPKKPDKKPAPQNKWERADCYFSNLTLCSRSEFMTTETELNAIAAPASHGASNPAAAIGMPREL